MSAVAEAGMAPSYNVRDTTARDGLIGDSRLNPFPEPHVPVLEKTESSIPAHGFMLRCIPRMGLLRSPKATVSRLQTRKEDVGTRDAQTYSLNFPGVLR